MRRSHLSRAGMGLSHLEQSEHLQGQRPLRRHTCEPTRNSTRPKAAPSLALPSSTCTDKTEKLIPRGIVREESTSLSACRAHACEEGGGPRPRPPPAAASAAPTGQQICPRSSNILLVAGSFSKVIKKEYFYDETN